MDPHRFEHDGSGYEVTFERTPDGWIARIRREGSDEVRVMAFPEGVGFDPDDPRGSLIAGSEAAVARYPASAPTRHWAVHAGTGTNASSFDGEHGTERGMSGVTYHVIEHDGGYAYKVGDTISETFATRDEAHRAAAIAAAEQRVPDDEDGEIEYQDVRGSRHVETARGNDRPVTEVDD